LPALSTDCARQAGASNGSAPYCVWRQTGNGRLNLYRALGDPSTDAVKPAGSNPGDGGPFVGAYVAAATLSLVPNSGSPGTSVNVTGSNGFGNNKSATVTFDSVIVSSCTTANGNLTSQCNFTVPSKAPGSYHVCAETTDPGGGQDCQLFTVTGQPDCTVTFALDSANSVASAAGSFSSSTCTLSQVGATTTSSCSVTWS
jgi:hypothetical protein